MQLIGVDAPLSPSSLWVRNRSMGLALAASMPCGRARVVEARSAICELLPLSSKLVSGTARVLDFSKAVRPWHGDMIYVGHAPSTFASSVLASPWGNPFCDSTDDVCSPGQFYSYLWDRCDLLWLLAPLVGKTIICHTGGSD